MKLVNAKLYEEQIRRKMWEIWYDEKYQYYFGGNWRNDFSLADNSGDYQKRAFAVLNNNDELIGYISYSVDNELRIAQWFGAINFSDDKMTFGRALRQVIEDCFLKFGLEVVEWCVICGNPIEKSYDRMCERLGGHIVGIRHRRAKDLAGNIHDDKSYEILREDFLRTMSRGKHPVNVYGVTEYYKDGLLESTYDGFGFRDSDGNIVWYGDYNPPKDDEFHLTTVTPYGNGKDLSEITK